MRTPTPLKSSSSSPPPLRKAKSCYQSNFVRRS